MTNRLTHRFAAATLTSLIVAAACAGADADAPEPHDDAATIPMTVETSGSSSASPD
ncbi:MAG: hypothetical protein ACE37B_22415 [Ilumatobacter sp.]|uniref:hypothetical protein n=1 Tax=Ilumatobacter sp. TaxID=1967498 RepID=UPI003919CC9A